MARLLSALLFGAVCALLFAACSGGTSEPTPLVNVGPLQAADGTVIPLPPHVAPEATPEQRDAFLDEQLRTEGLDGHQDQARGVCQSAGAGVPPIGVLFPLMSAGLDGQQAFKVAYLGVLTYCPEHRALYDSMLAMNHGGPVIDPVTGQEPQPIQLDPQLAEPQTDQPEPTTTTRAPRTRHSSSGSSSNETQSSGESQREWGCQQGYITEGC